MSSWDEGYFTEDGYTYGYYRELSPMFQRFCLIAHGIVPPEYGRESSHIELGFGQGVSAAIHAAATPGKYHGNDFSPSHAAHAIELAKAAGCGADFSDDSFEELLERDDLPRFDTISLHGVWTWVSAKNQELIVRFARRLLKPGGSLYVSYNCLPGWAPDSPLREIFALYDKYLRTGSGAKERMDGAIGFARALFDANPAYRGAAPHIIDRLENATRDKPNYFAHEYLNRDWNLSYFTDVAEKMAEAKLDFACTASPKESLGELSLARSAADFLRTIRHPIAREQARDYFVNRQFRKDIYIRGVRKLSAGESAKKIVSMRYVPAWKGSSTKDVSGGLQHSLTEYLMEDAPSPKSFELYLERHPNMTAKILAEAISILVSRAVIVPCNTEENASHLKGRTDALNAYLCKRAVSAGDLNLLASPVTGGAISIGRIEMSLIPFVKEGIEDPTQLARKAFRTFSSDEGGLFVDGIELRTPEEGLAELKKLVSVFLKDRLPFLRALGIL